MDNSKNTMNIAKFNKIQTVLNLPGQFCFQIEDEEVKNGKNNPLNRKRIEDILDNIKIIFKTISENLSPFLKYDQTYYNNIIYKLKNFASSKTLRFPGLQVINLTKNHIENFTKIPERILICEKSDGVRYLLIHFSNDKVLFLGRNLEFYLVDIIGGLPKSGNKNKLEWEIENLLDGELIVDKLNKTKEEIDEYINHLPPHHSLVYINKEYYEVKFIIFDAIFILGENIGHLKFRDRLKFLSEFFFKKDIKNKFYHKMLHFIEESIFDALTSKRDDLNTKIYENSNRFSIQIFMKDYYYFDDIELLYNKATKFLNHENDGVIINLDDYPYYSGQSSEIYKWKPASLNTIDFEVTVIHNNTYKKDLFVLNVNESRDKLLPVSCLFFQNEQELEKFKIELEEMKMSGKAIIVECFYNFNFFSQEVTNFHLLCESEIIKKSENKEGLVNLSNYIFDYTDQKKNNRVSEYGSWEFIRFRLDKKEPNHVSTYRSIWKTIMENLQISDISSKIKENLSKRVKLDSKIVLSSYLGSCNLKPMSFLDYDGDSIYNHDNSSNTVDNLNIHDVHSNDEYLKKKRGNTANDSVSEILSDIKLNESNSRNAYSDKKIKNSKIIKEKSDLTEILPNKRELRIKKDVDKKEKKIKQNHETLEIAFGRGTFDKKIDKILKEDVVPHDSNRQNKIHNPLLDDDHDSLKIEESDSDTDNEN